MTRRSLGSRLALAMFVVGTAGPALAHPDIAASVAVAFEVREEQMLALSERIVFDDATSQRVSRRFDTDGDGLLSQGEMTELSAELQHRLRARAFYTELSLDKAPLDLPEAVEVAVRFDGANLALQITLRPPTPLDLKGRTLGVLLRDRDLTIAFSLSKVPPVISGIAGACTARVEQRPDETYFGGLVTPDAVMLTCR